MKAYVFRLSIWDAELGANVSDIIELPVYQQSKVRKQVRGLKARTKEPVPIFSGADASSAVIAYLVPGKVLRSDAVLRDGWRRVMLPKKRIAFVAPKSVRVFRAKGYSKRASALRMAKGRAAPSFSLQEYKPIVSTDVLRFKGIVQNDRPVQDVYVFVNDHKVFYRAYPKKGKASGAVRVPVDVVLPLDEGANVISVVVRENDEFVGRKVVGILRQKSSISAHKVKGSTAVH